MVLVVALGKVIAHERCIPRLRSVIASIVILYNFELLLHLFRTCGLEFRRSHLLAQQFLINEPVERCFAVLRRNPLQRSPGNETFISHFILPVTLQDDVPIHGHRDPVEHLARAQKRRGEQKQSENGGSTNH